MRRCSLLLTLAVTLGCGGNGSVSIDVVFDDPTVPQPADPPYGADVVYPSGLRILLVADPGLTSTFPAPDQNPFGAIRSRHYEAVGAFLPLDLISASERVSEDFLLSEYVNPTTQRGGQRAYIDPQAVWHVQQHTAEQSR